MIALLPYLQLVLTFGNICVLAYALYKFLNKPHDTLETRVTAVEKRLDDNESDIRELKKSFDESDKEQKELNEVFINCMLAFIDFEMAYCIATGYKDTEDLTNAKRTLRAYLAKQ